jgi:hypothetical protein
VPGPGERIRFCLTCGDVLAFEATRCPACGAPAETPAAVAAEVADAAADGAGADAGPAPPMVLQPCPACGAAMQASLLFCPACGVDVGLVGTARRAPAAPPAPQAVDAGAGRIEVLAVALALLAPLLVVFAVAEVLVSAARG